MNVNREFFGAYYMSDEACKIWGTRQMHCYNCGTFTLDGESKQLNFVRMSTMRLADVHGDGAECFDLSLADSDEIAKHPLFQLAVSGEPMELSEELMTCFNAPVAQILAYDLQLGLTPYEIFEKRAALLVTQFMGFTFDEVLFNYPDILVETKNIDEQGNESVSVNIWRNSQEGAR